jgi:5-methylcytosine-specific restriction endonuclease McrA
MPSKATIWLDKLKAESPEKYEEFLEKQKERQRQWYINNSGKVKEKSKQYRLNNPERAKESVRKWVEDNPEKKKQSDRNWRKNNPEKSKGYGKKWREDHTEEEKERHRQYAKNNPEKIKEKNKRYSIKNPIKLLLKAIKLREKRFNIESVITEQDLVDIRDKFEHKCFVCGDAEDLCYDHFYPTKHKVSLNKDNCVLLCNSCNGKKGNKNPETFFSKRQMKKLKEQYLITIRTDL